MLSSSLECSHQRLHGGKEADVKLLVGEAGHGLAGVAPDLQPGGRRQRQDLLDGLGVAVLVVGQEARLASLEGDYNIQLGPAGLVHQDDLPCCHALHDT